MKIVEYLIIGILILTLPAQWLALKISDFILWIQLLIKRRWNGS